MTDEVEYVVQLETIVRELQKSAVAIRMSDRITDVALEVLRQMAADRRAENISRERRGPPAEQPGAQAWRDEPATDRQLKYLLDLGGHPREGMTKAEANELIKKLTGGE